MARWWQIFVAAIADVHPAAGFAAVALMAIGLIFALLCIAMRRGSRVSLCGPKGFVFEAMPKARQPAKGQK